MLDFASFRGVIGVYRGETALLERVQGDADMANARPLRMDTRFPVASGSKGFVAMGILRLIEEGKLSLDTRLKDAVDFDLHDIDPEITVEQLLTHTSGIPDYFDESVMEDYDELWVDYPCYKIRRSSDLLPLFVEKPMLYPRGEKFLYNNTGFVVLGLIMEKVTGKPFDEALSELLFAPCGMDATGYFENDRLPANCANAYIWDKTREEYYTNIFSVDVKGTGAGGAFTTVRDMNRFWNGLASGQVLTQPMFENACTVHAGSGEERYGYGLWLHGQPGRLLPSLEGCDPGVCFNSEYDPRTGITMTVISNFADDVWKIADALRNEFVPQKL